MKKLLFLLFMSPMLLLAQNPKALAIGSKAPEFEGLNQYQQTFSSKQTLKKGPLVVMFYRGQWCGYCTKQLAEMQDSLSILKELGASVVAITPETFENIERTLDKTGAQFPIVWDKGHAIMDLYSVSFDIDSEDAEKYEKYMEGGLSEAHGNDDDILPVPAVYIINKKGKIIYSYFDEDYKKRPSVASMMKALSESE